MLERIEPLVVGDCTKRLEFAKSRPVALVDLTDLGYCTHGMLSGKTEPCTNLGIVEFLQLELIGGLQLKSALSQPRTSFIERSHRGQQRGLLLWHHNQLDGRDQLHNYRPSTPMKDCNYNRQFLPALKDRASLASKDQQGAG